MDARDDDGRPLVVHLMHRLDVAGAEVLAADLARHLSDDYRFAFLCLDGLGTLGRRLSDEGFSVGSFARRPGIDLGLIGSLKRAWREQPVQIVHAHQYTPFFYAAASRTGRDDPPILFTEHGRHYPDRRRLRRCAINRFLVKRRDRITAVAPSVRDALCANEGLRQERIEVIPNGVDTTRYGPSPVLRRETRHALGIDGQRPVVLMVARFAPVKDHHTALRAFADVHRRLPQALLLLAGQGPGLEAARAAVGQLGLSDGVRFLGLRRDVPALMAASDVLFCSSLSEGLSVTLLEAMATAVPMVATDVGGNPMLVRNGENGFLAPRQDADGLAEHLVTLLGDASLRQRFGEAARRRATAHFGLATMHGRYAELYRAMRGASQRRAA